MNKDLRLSLLEFIEVNAAQEWEEFRSIEVHESYPFARSLQDLEGGYIGKTSDLPFANPEAAQGALRREQLGRLIWQQVCSVVETGEWQCHARREDALAWEAVPAKILCRAKPNLATLDLAIFGALYDDAEFTRAQPVSADDRAVVTIRRFCKLHDPAAHRVADIRAAILAETGLEMSDGHVRKLMKAADIDERWFAKGRRAARCARCKP